MSYDRFRNQREAYEETCRLIDNEFKRLNLDNWGGSEAAADDEPAGDCGGKEPSAG